MVRLGIALYGMDPGFFAIRGIRLCPVLTLKSQIAYLKTVDKGTYIGYERRYQAPSRTRIATVPVGYNDGYPYLLSNKANVLIRAQRARIAGTVTMDYIMVDVGHIAGIKTGEEVVLIGLSGQDRIRVEELASYIGTIPYEITCAIGRRVKRVYINGQV
jgi:alanine racemase